MFFSQNFESDSGYGSETNVESCRCRLRHSGSVATSESDAPNCFYCPRRDSHCANVDTWHFGQYAHQVFIQYSTSSGNFLVYHVTIPFGTVIKTTPRRRQQWGKETGCEACGEYRSHTDNRQIPTRRRKQVLSYSPSCMLCWRSPPKRDKAAGNHLWWSGHLLSKAKIWKLSGSMQPWRGGHLHHVACGTCC